MNTITTNVIHTAPKIRLMKGQIWRHDESKECYILAQTAFQKYALIGLQEGNRWENPGELDQVFAGKAFTLVTNESITITPPQRQRPQ